jgi:amidohydrolase
MNNLQNIINQKIDSLFEKVVGYREHLHKYPELSFQEVETSKFVFDTLQSIGIQQIEYIGKTGVTGLIIGKNHTLNDNFIGLRADLDALPIFEENEVSYKSVNKGVMHACGHDVHTSILLGAAEILNEIKDELPSPIKLIFQPGEEKNPGGASILIKEGVLQNPKVSYMFALHVYPEMLAGNIGYKPGLYMASCDEIYITIHGKGGHGAMPHQCIDPIVIGSNIVTTLQQIVSRNCDPKTPCVLTFGHFEALGATNVIPSKAILKGTFRTMDELWRKTALENIVKQVHQIAESLGGIAEIEISNGYPCLINDENLTNKTKDILKSTMGEDVVSELPIRLTSEDFAFYSQEVPVCFLRLGVGDNYKKINYGVHHPKFDIDANALKTGMKTICSIATNL